MISTHTLSSVVAASGSELQFIWSDGYSEIHAPDWTGWMRGVTAGRDAGGECERYDGTSPFNDSDEVLAAFLAKGGAVEPYEPTNTADNITNAPETFGGPTLKEIIDGN